MCTLQPASWVSTGLGLQVYVLVTPMEPEASVVPVSSLLHSSQHNSAEQIKLIQQIFMECRLCV